MHVQRQFALRTVGEGSGNDMWYWLQEHHHIVGVAAVQIEDAAQTQGWLFSRGAFDKTDLLYLVSLASMGHLILRVEATCRATTNRHACNQAEALGAAVQRDQEEKSRHTEMELHDREVLAYARLRMQNDKQKPASSGLGIAAKKIERHPR